MESVVEIRSPTPRKIGNNSMVLGVPRFQVNLDESEDKRWDKVIEAFSDQFIQVKKTIDEFVKEVLGKKGIVLQTMVAGMLNTLNKCGAIYYHKELKAISQKSGMSLGQVNFQILVCAYIAQFRIIWISQYRNQNKQNKKIKKSWY